MVGKHREEHPPQCRTCALGLLRLEKSPPRKGMRINLKLAKELTPPNDYLEGLSLEGLYREWEAASRELDWAQEMLNVGTKAREHYEEEYRRLERMVSQAEAILGDQRRELIEEERQ